MVQSVRNVDGAFAPAVGAVDPKEVPPLLGRRGICEAGRTGGATVSNWNHEGVHET